MILISVISILLTALMIILFFLIPGFPLLIFLFIPPLFCWGLQGREEQPPSTVHPAKKSLQYCPQCGKQLLEPFETYCPRCGTHLAHDEE